MTLSGSWAETVAAFAAPQDHQSAAALSAAAATFLLSIDIPFDPTQRRL